MRHPIAVLILLLALVGLILSDEVFQIGAFGQKGELIFPQQIAEGPDGNIYVYDQQDVFIKVYSPLGKFIREIGRRGQGPGEIQRVEGVTFGFMPDEKLYFTEYFSGHPWISLMELTGEFSSVIKLDFKERFGVGRIHPLQDGRFLAQLSLVGTPKKYKDFYVQGYPIKLFLLDKKGQSVSKMLEKESYSQISYYRFGRDTRLPFVPRFLWCYFQDNRILFTDGTSSKLKVYDFHGNLLKEIDTPLPEPEKVTDKDLSVWRKEWKEVLLPLEGGAWYRQFGNVIEKYKKSIYEVKPILDELSLTPDGNFLVTGIWDSEAGEVDYWLLNKSGEKLLHIRLPFRDVVITNSFIFYKLIDEDDIIQVYCMNRTTSEKDDLMKLRSLN